MTTRLTIPFLLFALLLSPLPTRQGAAFAQSARAVKTYALPAGESPVALLESGRRTWLFTQKSILERQRNHFVRKLEVSGTIACAVTRENELWLGTDSGIVAVNPDTYASRRVPLPAGEAYPSITTLFHTPAGAFYAGAADYGVFAYDPSGFRKVLGVAPVNTGLATPDSSAWIGTHTGLHHFKNGQWTRYTEEGVANFEIPGNIVDKLLDDGSGNLWVITTDGIGVLNRGPRAAGDHGHLPSVKFIGKPGNQVYGVQYLAERGSCLPRRRACCCCPRGRATSRGTTPPPTGSSRRNCSCPWRSPAPCRPVSGPRCWGPPGGKRTGWWVRERRLRYRPARCAAGCPARKTPLLHAKATLVALPQRKSNDDLIASGNQLSTALARKHGRLLILIFSLVLFSSVRFGVSFRCYR
jgi:hypothetical protein